MYSELIELTPWDTTNDRLRPSTILARSYQVLEKHLGYEYWPMLARAREKGVNFEATRLRVEMFDVKFNFPEQRRILLQSEFHTIHDRRMLRMDLTIRDAAATEVKLAKFTVELVEIVGIGSDWLGVSRGPGEQMESEIVKLVPELPPALGKPLNMLTVRSEAEASGSWIGPHISEHVVLPDSCEFVGMWTFVTSIGPLIDQAKWNCRKTFGSRDGCAAIAARDPFEYKNWVLSVDMKHPLYLHDEFTVETSAKTTSDAIWYRHQLFRKQPRLQTAVMFECCLL